jgi:hypothetical protein
MKLERSTGSFFLIGLIATGCLAFLVYSGSIALFPNADPVNAQSLDGPRFRFLFGGFRGDHATYTFQTPPQEKNFADDCIGCEQEVGNAVIFAEFGCPKKSKYLFESNSGNKNGVIEKTPVLDQDGSVVGEQRLIVFKNKEGILIAARMFWIEGHDFWAVQAPTVALTKALKEGNEYKSVRKRLTEEIKSYIPIQNANTKVKQPC